MQHKTTSQVFEEPQQMYRYSEVVSAAGATTVIPAPGQGRRIVLVYALIQNASSQTATTIQLCQVNVVNTFFRWLLASQGSLAEWIAVLGREGRMGENNPVVLVQSAAATLNVNLYWFVEDI